MAKYGEWLTGGQMALIDGGRTCMQLLEAGLCAEGTFVYFSLVSQ